MNRCSKLAALTALAALLVAPAAARAADGGYVVTPYVAPYLTDASTSSLALDNAGNLAVVRAGTGHMDGSVVRLTDLNGDGLIDNAAEARVVLSGLPSSLFFDAESGGEAAAGPAAAAWSPSGGLYGISNAFWPDFANDDYGSVWSSAAPNDSTNPLRQASPYASLARYEAANNPDGGEINPNPFKLVVDADGNAYVNDAGANDTLKVTPDGTITTYALYPPVEIPAELGLPFPFAEPVPTGIAFGPDGALYVSQLVGFPFFAGSASVYRLEDVNGDGDAMDDGEMTVMADGLTTVTDIAFGPDGALYASEFRGFLTSGDESPDAPPPADGDIVRWTGDGWETVVSGLAMPTSVRVAPDGAVYILTLDGAVWRATPAG